MAANRSKDLLHLEHRSSSSPLECTLLVCKNDSLTQDKKLPPEGKSFTAPFPQSQVLGKVKDFLGVISEANKRLELEAKDNSQAFDIETLTGNESEIIEMDLMLGVADLQTPEAVAAAESTIAGYQPVTSLADSSSETESEDSSDDDDDEDEDSEDDDKSFSSEKFQSFHSGQNDCLSQASGNKSKIRSKIVELA